MFITLQDMKDQARAECKELLEGKLQYQQIITHFEARKKMSKEHERMIMEEIKKHSYGIPEALAETHDYKEKM